MIKRTSTTKKAATRNAILSRNVDWKSGTLAKAGNGWSMSEVCAAEIDLDRKTLPPAEQNAERGKKHNSIESSDH
jgi:hypothetical protein